MGWTLPSDAGEAEACIRQQVTLLARNEIAVMRAAMRPDEPDPGARIFLERIQLARFNFVPDETGEHGNSASVGQQG